MRSQVLQHHRLPGARPPSSAFRTPVRPPIAYRCGLPPGVGEVELDLALVYASRNGSGTAGTGWSIAGLSTIARCNRTWAQDGTAAGVTNTLA